MSMHAPSPLHPAKSEVAVEVDRGKESNKLPAVSLTAVGVVALFSYFFHIDYFPLFDLQAASSYLFAVLWVLLVLLVLFAFLLLVPCAIIGMTLRAYKTARGERKLTNSIIFWVGFGMVSLIALSLGVLLTIWLQWSIFWGLLIGLGVSLSLSALITHLKVATLRKKYIGAIFSPWKKKLIRKLYLGELAVAALSSFLQLAPLCVLLFMFSRASGLPEDDFPGYARVSAQCALFIAIVGGTVLFVIFIPRYRRHWWLALCLMLALPFALTGVSQSTGMLPMTMAQLTKIGNFRAEKMILSPKACGSVASILGIDCDEKTSPPIQLCNVQIMSRIGPETYLRVAEKNPESDGKYAIRRIFIPSAEITSMQVNFEIKNLRLDLIDSDLGGRSSDCDTTLTTLHGDSAFDFNDFSLTDSGKVQLLTFIQEIKNGARGIQEVKVTGHADQIGAGEHNAWLAARRAQEVKLFMDKRLKNAAPEITINATSIGSSQPLIKDCGALTVLKERIKCEAPNRRVELEIIKKSTLK